MIAPTPRSYLVTGGHGYVGSWIVRRLAEAGNKVFTLSRAKGPVPFVRPLSARAAPEQICADLVSLSVEELAALLPPDLDGCVHTASFNETFAPGYPEKSLQANAWATRKLLDALILLGRGRDTPGRPPLFLYCSTFHVYGASSGIVTEDLPPAPVNDYALTHLFAEQYCRMAERAHGLPCVILRLTNGYGAPLTRPFGKWYLLLNDLCRQAFLEGAVSLRSNPAVRRDFVWLGDVARVVEALLLRPDLAGSLFNVAREATLSIGEVAELAAKTASRVLERTISLRLEQPPVETPDLRVDASRLYRVLDKALGEATSGESGHAFTDAMPETMEGILRYLRTYGM